MVWPVLQKSTSLRPTTDATYRKHSPSPPFSLDFRSISLIPCYYLKLECCGKIFPVRGAGNTTLEQKRNGTSKSRRTSSIHHNNLLPPRPRVQQIFRLGLRTFKLSRLHTNSRRPAEGAFDASVLYLGRLCTDGSVQLPLPSAAN